MQSKSLKIACIDNMNNNMFCVARYLRDFGHEADVFVVNKTMPHFEPAADTYDDNYMSFVFNVNWADLPAGERIVQVSQTLSKYDIVFGCGYAPAYLSEINRGLDVFLPYGGDISVMPTFFFEANVVNRYFYNNSKKLFKLFYSLPQFINKPFRKYFNKFNLQAELFYLAKQQINGIKNAKITLQLEANEVTEGYYNKINSSSKRLKVAIPFIYTSNYKAENIEKVKETSTYYKRFKSIRDGNKLVIFHHARHVWKNSFEPTSWKANDVLIKGFADFLKQSSNYNACLVMFEYGGDVDESKRLIKQLGIEKNIEWFPTMPRKDIMIGLSLADIGCSEFAISWVMGGTIFEILCMGKPLFHYLEEKLYAKEDIFPHVNIKSKEDITKHLLGYIDNSKPYIEQAINGQNWFFENAINKPLESIKIELNNLLTNNNN